MSIYGSCTTKGLYCVPPTVEGDLAVNLQTRGRDGSGPDRRADHVQPKPYVPVMPYAACDYSVGACVRGGLVVCA